MCVYNHMESRDIPFRAMWPSHLESGSALAKETLSGVILQAGRGEELVKWMVKLDGSWTMMMVNHGAPVV